MRLVNSDDHSRSIIPLPDASLAIARPEAGRKLAEMNDELRPLALWETLCEPDRQQILLWSEDLALEPEEVIRRMLDVGVSSQGPENWNDLDTDLSEETTFREGRMVSVYWNVERLPLPDFRWVDGLEIEALTIVTPQSDATTMRHVRLSLPKLRMLHSVGLGIEKLELSYVPLLDELWCDKNRLTEIDLSNVPKLRALYCSGNELDRIDASKCVSLEQLGCSENRMKYLDISGCQSLVYLDCSKNRLRALRLEDQGELESLDCSGNLIVRLFIEATPLGVYDFVYDYWVFVVGDNVSNGGLGYLPPTVFHRLRLDKTQPEAAYSDWNAYLRSHHHATLKPYTDPRPQ